VNEYIYFKYEINLEGKIGGDIHRNTQNNSEFYQIISWVLRNLEIPG
jgi:hypothetical protein